MPDYLYEFTEEQILGLKRSVSGRPRPHCLIGRGLGNQLYSKCDYSWKGIWLFEQYDVANGFADADGLLQKYTDAEWDLRQQDYLYDLEIKPADNGKPIGVKRGDLCRVNVKGEPLTILEAKKIDTKADGVVSVQLGAKKPDWRKLWESRSSGSSGYTDYYLWPIRKPKTGSCTIITRDTVHNACAQGTMSIAIPDEVLDSDLDRALLDISLSTETVQDRLHRWGVVVEVDGEINQYTVLPNYLIDPAGSISISDMDITDLITQNATNDIDVFMFLHENYWKTHTLCSEHPTFSCSASIKFMRRLFGP